MVTQKMKKINLIKNLEKYPTFNIKVLKDIIEKDSEYAKLVIYRLKKEKLIFEIEKNKYTTRKDPLVVASNILWPSYISGWSSLRYYNLTEQLPQTISIFTTRARGKKEIFFNNTRIKITKIKPKYFFGYKKVRYRDCEIFIADKEKALLDSALFKKVSFSEIMNAVKNNKKEIDLDLFLKYLIKLKNKALIKRFGFLLDMVKIDVYDELKRFIDYKYIPLDYAMKPKGKRNKKWRIINNVRY